MAFAHIVREDRSVLELIDSDYTFLNERLAKHYGLTNLDVDRRRDAPRRRCRRTARAAACSRTARCWSSRRIPTRTSPVKRGLFILDNILGHAAAAAAAGHSEPGGFREGDRRTASRRCAKCWPSTARSRCAASCHNRMDPLGLALENFNALGMWREKERSQPIDAAGKLITGETFDDIRELKRILATKHRARFLPLPDREAADLRAGPRAGVLRRGDGRPNRRAARQGQRPFLRAADGHHRVRAVPKTAQHFFNQRRRSEPSEQSGTKPKQSHEHEPSRTSLPNASPVSTAAISCAASARAWRCRRSNRCGRSRARCRSRRGAKLATHRRPARRCAWRSSISRTARSSRTGGRRAKARTSNSARTLEPLAKVKHQLQVLGGLDHVNATPGPDGAGDHARASGTFLTGVRVKKTAGADIHAGISIDQVDGEPDRPPHAVSLARTDLRRGAQIRQLRLRLFLRLPVQPRLAFADHAGGARAESAAGLRAAVRRRRARRTREEPRSAASSSSAPSSISCSTTRARCSAS